MTTHEERCRLYQLKLDAEFELNAASDSARAANDAASEAMQLLAEKITAFDIAYKSWDDAKKELER